MQITLSNPLSQRCRQSECRQPARKLSEIMFIGSYAPRQCGIATFTQDLRGSMIAARPTLEARVARMAEECGGRHPAEVEHTVAERERASYAGLGNNLNAAGTEAVSLQHEYGIFGGPDGAWILDTLRDLRAPVVTTCHTVLENPSPGQRQMLCEIGRLSARMVVLDASRGVLVPFAAPKAIAEAAVELFGDPERMQRMSQAACKAGRQTTWLQTGRQYLQLFDGLIAQQVRVDSSRPKENMPAHPQLRHLHRLTGPWGIYQHANHEEPDPEHGWDDLLEQMKAEI